MAQLICRNVLTKSSAINSMKISLGINQTTVRSLVGSSGCRMLNHGISQKECNRSHPILNRHLQPSLRSFGAYGPDWYPVDMKEVEDRVLKTCRAYDKIGETSQVFKIQKRHFGHKAPLTYDFIVERVILVLELYDKVDNSKLKLDSNFQTDLGLDSLDHVEVIMAIEDEFHFEIPDKDAEKLLTPADIIKYVADKEEAWRELQTQDHDKYLGNDPFK